MKTAIDQATKATGLPNYETRTGGDERGTIHRCNAVSQSMYLRRPTATTPNEPLRKWGSNIANANAAHQPPQMTLNQTDHHSSLTCQMVAVGADYIGYYIRCWIDVVRKQAYGSGENTGDPHYKRSLLDSEFERWLSATHVEALQGE